MIRSGKLKTKEDLKNIPLIQIELAMNDWPLWLQAAGVDPAIYRDGPVVDNYLQTIERVYDGEALVMGRTPFVARDLREGRLVRPFELTVPEPGRWYMVTPKDNRICKEPIYSVSSDWNRFVGR